MIDAAAPVPRLALFPARAQDGGAKVRSRGTSDEKGPARHVCWITHFLRPRQKGAVRSRARQKTTPTRGTKFKFDFRLRRRASTCTPGTGRDDGPEGKCVRNRPSRRRAEAPAPLVPSERVAPPSATRAQKRIRRFDCPPSL